RRLFWIIILLTILAAYINLPKIPINKNITIDPNSVLQKLKINKELTFRQGLDLEGGTSLILKANMNNVSSSQKSSALESAKVVIENRVNLFGVSEPLVQTSVANKDYRVIVELPGLTDVNQ